MTSRLRVVGAARPLSIASGGRHTVAMKGLVLDVLALLLGMALGLNLSCYQCLRMSYEPCPPEALLPCPENKDRCVTHVARDEQGLRVRRECGLGLCGFSDSAMSRGLGLDALCDTSRDTFSCLTCCRTTGCNKDLSSARPLFALMFLALVPPQIA